MTATTIDDLAQAAVKSDTPGVAVAVIHQGKVLHCQGYGLANLEWQSPVTATTVFHLASLTKPFTALAVMLLAAQGKLDLNDPITTYLPEYPTDGAAIILTHLLTHTSGIPNYVTQPGFWEHDSRTDRAPAQLLDLFQHRPLDFTPGSRYRYSNSAYCLLGLIIEAVAGMPYEEYLRAAIFTPLGMHDARLMTDEAIIPQRAAGYDRVGAVYQHAPYMSMTLPYASGSLGATLDDLIRWDAGMREHTLIDHATQERMWSPLRLNSGREEGYGLGWGISHYRGHKVVHHAGGVPGFSTFCGHFIADDCSIIILTNEGSFQGDRLARQIADLVLQIPMSECVPVALPNAALERIAGIYMGDFGSQVIVTFNDTTPHLKSGRLDQDMLPLDETHFYLVSGHGDVVVQFEDRAENGFRRVTVSYPFYWFAAYRDDERPIGAC